MNPSDVQPSAMAAMLGAGIETLDLAETHEFIIYERVVLPIDGYVFWKPTGALMVNGALHFTQDIVQEEDETYGLARVRFTTMQRIAEFEAIPINRIFVCRHAGFRFAFSRQNGFFRAASVWHYEGSSIPPDMETTLLERPEQIDFTQAVVSNSLPIWLSLNGYVSPYQGGFSNPVTLYPSEVVPPNLSPPYGVVHIPEDGTRSVSAVPLVQQVNTGTVEDPSYTRVSTQLMADRVRVTLIGLQNSDAIDFLNCAMEYMRCAGFMGLMNAPSLRDAKRSQRELQALAMKKTIDFEVSYVQWAAEQVALALLESATVNFYVSGQTALLTESGDDILTEGGQPILVG